jgi:hypothetical protein
MGAWAPDAFGNDAALDAAGGLTSETAVIEALESFLAAERAGLGHFDLIEPAYAAAEIIALSRRSEQGEDIWQSEGTTLFAGGEGTHYVPEEVASFIESGPAFSDEVAAKAVHVVNSLYHDPEREGWSDIEGRRAALAATRERLLNPVRPWAEIEPGTRERPSPLAEL